MHLFATYCVFGVKEVPLKYENFLYECFFQVAKSVYILWGLSVYGQCAEFAVFAPESLSPHGKTFHKKNVSDNCIHQRRVVCTK